MRCPECDTLLGEDILEWNYKKNFKYLRCPICGWISDERLRNREKNIGRKYGRKVA